MSENTRRQRMALNEELKTLLVKFVEPRNKYLFGSFIGFDGRERRIQAWNEILRYAREYK